MMNKIILPLFLLVVGCTYVRSTGEEYTGYILLSRNDDTYCLVTSEDSSTTTGFVPAVYGPTANQTNIFQNCTYWIVKNATDPEKNSNEMTLRTADNRALYIFVAPITSSLPTAALSAIEGTPLSFVKDEVLNAADLDDFLNESVYVSLTFTIPFRRFQGFCFVTQLASIGEDIFSLRLVPTGLNGGAFCTSRDGEWTFQPFSHCTSFPCQNGGTCMDAADADDFVCQCAQGFGGKSCQIESPCNTLPCSNGATCSPTQDFTDYVCTCPEQFFGKNCDIVDPCKDRDCTCSATSDGLDYICNCLDVTNISGRRAQCGKDCDKDCNLGCIGTHWRDGKDKFNICSSGVIKRAKRSGKQLICCRDRCTAMKSSQIDNCGDKCHQLDCIEESILEEHCENKETGDKKPGGWGSRRKNKGGRWGNRWKRTRSSIWGKSRCEIPSDTTSCLL